VEAVGGGVTAFKVGDRVFGFSGTAFGAHAEYLALPEHESMMATIPEGLTFEEAAPGAISEGQSRYRAVSHGHCHPATDLAVQRSSSMNASCECA
jgi:D-arabinose 1-dehydrogenase-like Zn-dependent alcohol dehydrogenase